MKYPIITFVTLFMALALAACGGGEAEAPAESGDAGSASVDVVMHDIYYGDDNTNADNPPVWTVPSGSEFTVNMENVGALEHNWAVVEPGEEVPVPFVEADSSGIIAADSGLVAGGESGSTTFSALEAGEYDVICTVAGHYPSMQGRLVVE